MWFGMRFGMWFFNFICLGARFALQSSLYRLCFAKLAVLVGSFCFAKLALFGFVLQSLRCWLARFVLQSSLYRLCFAKLDIGGKPLLKQRLSPQAPFPKNFRYYV